MRIAAFLPELLRHLFKKPATVDYPFKKLEVPKGFRGTPFLYADKCIVCRACVRDCPAESIDILTLDEAEKKYKMIIHNDRCIHCAQCVDSCPTDALEMDLLFETSAFSRWDLKREWDFVKAVIKPKTPAAPPPAATPSDPGSAAPAQEPSPGSGSLAS